MDLRKEFSMIRGEAIRVHPKPVEDIPCIETSNADLICKKPLVSVYMITYNHGPFIRKAIEGVMMQRTDFPYELVIGEDCSQDDTREICFDCQRQYPDKIRVLWANENVYLKGSNDRRTFARCRGEYIALCEGDDYWTDPLKLQKQVDVMRAHPNVGLCFCGAMFMSELNGVKTTRTWNDRHDVPLGLMSGKEFFLKHSFGKTLWATGRRDEKFIMTATTMVKASALQQVLREYSICDWHLSILDSILWLGVASRMDVYYLPDVVSVYRQMQTGACGKSVARVWGDGQIVRAWYYLQVMKRSLRETPNLFRGMFLYHCLTTIPQRTGKSVRDYLDSVRRTSVGEDLFGGIGLWPVRCLFALFPTSRVIRGLLFRYVTIVYARLPSPKRVRDDYRSFRRRPE